MTADQLGGLSGSNRATTTERRTTTTTTTKRTVKSSDDFAPGELRAESPSASSQAGAARASKWPDSLQSPTIEDTSDGRVLRLRFDVTSYEPEELVVRTIDNRLTVQAKHEEKSENRSVYREYNREFHLPDGVDIELIKSTLSSDGVLTVDCPLPAPKVQASSRRIPIDKAN